MRKEISCLISGHFWRCFRGKKLFEKVDDFTIETAVFSFCSLLYPVVQVNGEADLKGFVFLFVKVLIVCGFICHSLSIIVCFENIFNYFQIFLINPLTTISNYDRL